MTCGGLWVSANTGAWMVKSMIVIMAMLKIFAMSARVSFVLTCLKIFPQLGQNGSVGFVCGWLHVGQGLVGLGFLKAFSVIASSRSVPINISAVAPIVWKN